MFHTPCYACIVATVGAGAPIMSHLLENMSAGYYDDDVAWRYSGHNTGSSKIPNEDASMNICQAQSVNVRGGVQHHAVAFPSVLAP
jgi:hypothetical protein